MNIKSLGIMLAVCVIGVWAWQLWAHSLLFPQVYFSPIDKVRSKLVTRIKQEKESIKAAIYLLTDKEVAHALGNAHKRGIPVEVVVDKSTTESEWGQAPVLHSYGVTVFVYETDDDGIMHNKFFVFGNNGGKKLVWTGSYNPTHKADKRNRENVIIDDNEHVARAYEQEFERLKKVSVVHQEKVDHVKRESLSAQKERHPLRPSIALQGPMLKDFSLHTHCGW